MSVIKSRGQVYTPPHLVEHILNLAGYEGANILCKHVMDNSCGDGAFLVEVVKRYCIAHQNQFGEIHAAQLSQQLKHYIHGIEISRAATEVCRYRLNQLIATYGLDALDWDIRVADTLDIYPVFSEQMDYVVGNPPYVRVHNLASDKADNYAAVKRLRFCAQGMTDLYLAFFEMSLAMLNVSGTLALITPSSFLRSKAGAPIRQFVQEHPCLRALVDLGHYQPFAGITTYTAISIIEKGQSFQQLAYYEYNREQGAPTWVANIDYTKIFVNGKMYVSQPQSLDLLHQIETHYAHAPKTVRVKNGLATLADKVFIGAFAFDEGLIDVYKASTGQWKKCVFPYDINARAMDEAHIENALPQMWAHLSEHKLILNKRDIADSSQWYLFGRTQALNDVFVEKVAVNTTIKNVASIKIARVPAGSALYSGLYVLSQYSVGQIQKALCQPQFIDYLRLLKNYKSGGYYSFSSLELEKYLIYQLASDSQTSAPIQSSRFNLLTA